MKTVIDTADVLVLDEQPWLAGLVVIMVTLVFASVGWVLFAAGEWIGGLMFVVGGLGMGLIVFWAFVRRTQLWIDRTTGRVAIRQRSLFGYGEQILPLADLTGADLQLSTSSRSQRAYRAVLHFGGQTDRKVPVTIYYVTGRGPRGTADAINAWLSRNA